MKYPINLTKLEDISKDVIPSLIESNPPNIPETKLDFALDEWVLVIYDDCWYPGVIEKIKRDNLTITFMERKDNIFKWPNPEDCQTVKKSGIFKKMTSPPLPINNTYFKIANYEIIDQEVVQFLKNNIL
uniref:Uncharacterized protein LOC114345898 n=1 Tax=Diabrotica virgifera virgifera TaxID=50390 RepID=A0A6P7H4A3_DIAVI